MADTSGPGWRSLPARALVAAIAVLYVSALFRDPALQAPPMALAAAGLSLLLIAGGLGLMARPRSPLPVAGVVAAALGMAWITPRGAGGAPIYVVAALLATRLPFVRALAWMVPAAAAALAIEQVRAPVHDPTALAAQGLGLGLTFLAFYSIHRTRQQRLADREAQVDAARVEERARLARDVHDVLAHSLTALTVQLDLARAQLRRNPADPAALATIERAHGLARQGLEEARRAVGALRGEGPGPAQLATLADQFHADTGVACELRLAPDVPALSPEEQAAIYRIAQEALTNVRKHAAPERVTVRLAPDSGGVALTVENDGHPKPSLHSGGYGLTGMRERAEGLGGRLEAGPTEAGYRVRLWLPA